MHRSAAALSALILSATASAQVPDGYYVWGSFQGTAGINGIYFSHPRDPLQPMLSVSNLPPALGYDPSGKRGVACLLRRASDEALLVGERAPAGTSVDLHVLKLSGSSVVFAQLFSVGTSANVGEIPQCALLPDGRVLLAATDLQPGGPLAHFLTAQYNWQGIGLLDTVGGGVTALPISNWSSLPGVINAITATRDGKTAYIGNYISAAGGDLWSVPLPNGGAATLVANLPAGVSNLAVDNDGTVLVTTLNGPPNLFRYDPLSKALTVIVTASGPLNAIAVETVSGNYALATANAGVPPRSLLWVTPAGVETLLLSPNRATIAAVDVNPNPEAFGQATSGTGTYTWDLAPNPGGMPLLGNSNFSLTLKTMLPTASVALFSTDRAPTPVEILGVKVHLDLTKVFWAPVLTPAPTMTIPLPIPNEPVLQGLKLVVQSFHLEPTQLLSASSGVELTLF